MTDSPKPKFDALAYVEKWKAVRTPETDTIEHRKQWVNSLMASGELTTGTAGSIRMQMARLDVKEGKRAPFKVGGGRKRGDNYPRKDHEIKRAQEEARAQIAGESEDDSTLRKAEELIDLALEGKGVSPDRLRAAMMVKKTYKDESKVANPYAGMGAGELAERSLQTAVALVGLPTVWKTLEALISKGMEGVVVPGTWVPAEMAAWKLKQEAAGGGIGDERPMAVVGPDSGQVGGDGGIVAGGGEASSKEEPVLHGEIHHGAGESVERGVVGVEPQSYSTVPLVMVGVVDAGGTA